MALAWKLLALIAVLVMPLAMAPAAASPVHQASMPMEHCPDQAPRHDQGGIAECTMACAAALPAIPTKQDAPLVVASVPSQASPTRHLHGLDPETATPPPRRY
jgi:hypothetical protein